MLDINGFNLSTEPIFVQGTGVSSAGAIVNTGAQQTSALTNVTMTGDTTLGGSGRWDIRGTGAALSTGGAAYNLTKTGANQISFVATASFVATVARVPASLVPTAAFVAVGSTVAVGPIGAFEIAEVAARRVRVGLDSPARSPTS
jgi:hypothetical protein